MKTVAIAGLVLAMAVTAFAGGNPNVKAYISFDQTGAGLPIHSYTMAPYTPFDAYVCLTDVGMGVTTVSFYVTDLDTDFPGLFLVAPSFTNLLPGDLAIGNIYTGITIAATSCQTQDPVIVCKLSYVPTAAGDMCLNILPHLQWPRWVTDCTEPNALVDFYTVLENGSIGTIICPPSTPVEDETWGGIKAMYR